MFAASTIAKYIIELSPFAWSITAYGGALRHNYRDVRLCRHRRRNVLAQRHRHYTPTIGSALALLAYAAVMLGIAIGLQIG